MVYLVTIVAGRDERLNKFWPMVIGCIIFTAGRSSYADQLSLLYLFYFEILMTSVSSTIYPGPLREKKFNQFLFELIKEHDKDKDPFPGEDLFV